MIGWPLGGEELASATAHLLDILAVLPCQMNVMRSCIRLKQRWTGKALKPGPSPQCSAERRFRSELVVYSEHDVVGVEDARRCGTRSPFGQTGRNPD